jgi:hypothetical protein
LRHVPRQPREGINVSDTHPLVEAGTLIVGLSAIFVAIVVLFVFLVEVVLYFVPAEKEAALFQDWLPVDLLTVSPADDRSPRAGRTPRMTFVSRSTGPRLPTPWRCRAV